MFNDDQSQTEPETTHTGRSLPSGTSEAQSGNQSKLLYFDADRNSGRIMRMVLQQAGFPDFDAFMDSEECLQAHDMHGYEIVLINFPSETGPHAKLALSLRKSERKKDNIKSDIEKLHIAAILPVGTKPLIKAAILTGASAIWIKPLSPASVQKRLKALQKMLRPNDCRKALLEKLDEL